MSACPECHRTGDHKLDCSRRPGRQAVVLPFITHAAPLIARQVREQVGREIEADRADLKSRVGDDPVDLYERGRLYGESVAARIARGDS